MQKVQCVRNPLKGFKLWSGLWETNNKPWLYFTVYFNVDRLGQQLYFNRQLYAGQVPFDAFYIVYAQIKDVLFRLKFNSEQYFSIQN